MNEGILVMCSGVANTSLPFKGNQDLMAYKCLMSGYAESVAKIEEIGEPEKIDNNLIHKNFIVRQSKIT